MRRDTGALAGRSFDLAVVGGGMHGAWIALRAARAGLRVALLEGADFGSGTSANSLKILHGGLRYLQNLDLGRMRASIRARRAYAQACGHLFTPLPCVMPLRSSGLRSPWVLGPALLANDLIGVDRNRGVGADHRLPRGRLLSGEACARAISPLVPMRPVAGAQWWDAVVRDTARLVLEVVLAAADAGATVANHLRVERILHAAGRVAGLAFTDVLTGRSGELRATRVVNATGPRALNLARASGLPVSALPQAWTGALNVVLRRPLGNTMAVALTLPREQARPDSMLRRGARELFFVPWRQRAMIGTAYFPVASIEEGAAPPEGAIVRFMDQAAELAPAAALSAADVAMAHWGLLPLADPGDSLPRKSPLILADAADSGADGLVHVIGEKLTSAPVVSARVLRRMGVGDGERRPLRFELPPVHPAIEGSGGISAPRRDQVLRRAVNEEMAVTLGDLIRRTGLAELGHPGAEVLAGLIDWAVREAGWDRQAMRVQAAQVEAWFAQRGAVPVAGPAAQVA